MTKTERRRRGVQRGEALRRGSGGVPRIHPPPFRGGGRETTRRTARDRPSVQRGGAGCAEGRSPSPGVRASPGSPQTWGGAGWQQSDEDGATKTGCAEGRSPSPGVRGCPPDHPEPGRCGWQQSDEDGATKTGCAEGRSPSPGSGRPPDSPPHSADGGGRQRGERREIDRACRGVELGVQRGGAPRRGSGGVPRLPHHRLGGGVGWGRHHGERRTEGVPI